MFQREETMIASVFNEDVTAHTTPNTKHSGEVTNAAITPRIYPRQANTFLLPASAEQ